MARKYENIENISKLISGGAVAELSKRVAGAERTASDILRKLNEIEAAARQKKLEEEQAAAARAAEEEAARAAERERILAAEREAEKQRLAAEEAKEKQKAAEAEKSEPAAPVTAKEPEKAAEPVKTQPVQRPSDAAAKKPDTRAGASSQPAATYRNDGQRAQGARPVRPENKTFINRDSRPPRPQGGNFRGNAAQGTQGFRPNGSGQGQYPRTGAPRFGAAAPLPQLSPRRRRTSARTRRSRAMKRRTWRRRTRPCPSARCKSSRARA